MQSVEGDKAVFINEVPRPGIPNAIIYRRVNEDLEYRGTDDPEAEPSESDLIILFQRMDN